MDDTITNEERRRLLDEMDGADWYPTCTYCKGMQKDSERFVPAEQLTKEEMELVKKGARSYQEVLEMKKKAEEKL